MESKLDSKYIQDYSFPNQLYKNGDFLYVISKDLEKNDIFKMMVIGHRVKFYTKGNELQYYICQYPTTIYVRDDMRWEDTVQHDRINSKNGWMSERWTHNRHSYFIADSAEKVIKMKKDLLREEINKHQETLNNLEMGS